MTRHVGLVGFFGWGNFGDELMLRGWKEALRDVEAEPVNTLLQKPYFDRPAAQVAAATDALLIGGGDLLHPDAMSALYWNRAWLARPIVVSGVGVALERHRERPDVIERLQRFFGHSSVRSITARDQDSAAWIRDRLTPQTEVGVIPDLGFAARLPARPEAREDVVRIVLRKKPAETDKVQVQRVRDWAEKTGLRTELLILAVGHEAALEAEALRSCELGLTVRIEHSLDELIAAIGRCRLLVTAKFHGAVIAARCNVPSVSLRATHKISALARELDCAQMNLLVSDADFADLDRALLSSPPAAAIERAELEAARAVAEATTEVMAS